MFETFVAATFLKAGFTIELVDERADHTTRPVEFNATFPKTGRMFSIEVKSHHSRANDSKIRAKDKLIDALGKTSPHERVIFLEVNRKDNIQNPTSDAWWNDVHNQIIELEDKDNEENVLPSAYIFVTNHSFIRNSDELDTSIQLLF
jgi:hypothetical protein